jgi:Protein of unknown function (DUF4231)
MIFLLPEEHLMATQVEEPEVDFPRTDEDRLKYVLDGAEAQRAFYQWETTKNYWLHYLCTVTTLVGAATAPLLVFVLPQQPPMMKLWTALPSAVAVVATGVGSAFGFKQSWVESYSALTAVLDEIDRFKAGTPPDYPPDQPLDLRIGKFQSRLSRIVLQQTAAFRQNASHKSEKKN